MKLELYENDLEPKHCQANVGQIDFEMFETKVKWAIMQVGEAVYYNADRSHHEVVRPPKDGDERFKEGDRVHWNQSRKALNLDSYHKSLNGKMTVIKVEQRDEPHIGHPQLVTVRFKDDTEGLLDGFWLGKKPLSTFG